MRRSLQLLALAAAGLLAGPLLAAGKIELEIVSDPKQQQLNAQQWLRTFAELKVGGLQIRSMRPGDEVGVVVVGGGDNPTYKVTGMLNDRNELLLPGGRFKIDDRRRLAEWAKKLANEGPNADANKNAPFGMSEAKLKAVRDLLHVPVAGSTKGQPRSAVAAELRRQIASPIALPAGFDAALDAAGAVEEELQGFSAGTALAIVLRPAGLGLVPRRAKAGVELAVVKPAATDQIWPPGFSAEDRRLELAPVLFQMIEVEINKIPLQQALDAIGPRLAVPIVLDRNGLALVNVDPRTAKVSVPAKKTSYGVILRQLLGPLKLVYELRTDEAGKPFVWVTDFKTR